MLGEELKNSTCVTTFQHEEVKHGQNEEKIRFKEFLYSYAPVTSGTLSDRRLPYNTYSEFYDVYTKKMKEMALTTRSITTIINWIKEFKVKRESFDRYRCEKCYDGRVAESKFKKGELDDIYNERIPLEYKY